MGAAARVLVVDGERLILNFVGSTLKRRGDVQVFSATGARQALEIVRKQLPIDLVLCDLDLPEMGGPELIREVQQISPETSAVLMTGGTVHSEGIPPEMPVLLKPFSTQHLLDTVQAVLARAAQAKADLEREWESAAALLQSSRQIISEVRSAIEEAAETVRKAQKRVKNGSS